MDVRAAVAVAPGKPLEVTTVQLDGPRAREVLVEIKATRTRTCTMRQPSRNTSTMILMISSTGSAKRIVVITPS